MSPRPFLTLPLEVRNIIYEFYFGRDLTVWTGKWIEGRNEAPKSWTVALLYANKQVYAESSRFFHNALLELSINDSFHAVEIEACTGILHLPCLTNKCAILRMNYQLKNLKTTHMLASKFINFRRFRVFFSFAPGSKPRHIGARTLMRALSALPSIKEIEVQVNGNVLYCNNIKDALMPFCALKGAPKISFTLAPPFAAVLCPDDEYEGFDPEYCLKHQAGLKRYFDELQRAIQNGDTTMLTADET